MIRNFDELLELVRSQPRKTVAIAAAHTPTAIDAAIMAYRENLGDALLVGDAAFINDYLKTNAADLAEAFTIIDTGHDLAAAAAASVQAVRDGKADLILKGKCDSGTLLRAVLHKEKGLRTGNVMSDVLAYETPDRVILMGDGGFLPLPDLKEKISVINNCVAVAHKLGAENPKVALLTHSEQVSPKIQSTVDAAIISKMNARGQIKGCTVDGPLAFDNAISAKAARMKGIVSPVAGDADILVVPNIEAGNIFGKALTYYCKYRVCHVVMGAKAPILIASRADDAETKMLSIALGIISS
ncbi:MAG: bifunctional enoyl-CoA hydratase/phosphate acetyltransferase [Candidatus Cloacimonetes bacterium]|nr:bifunctional enoyl-CoA hydratase/phosphate acetyltransferase [Candidatus Cloacimonadota bacterium]